MRRPREEAVVEVEVLRDDLAVEPSPELGRAGFAGLVPPGTVEAQKCAGRSRLAHVVRGQLLGRGAPRGLGLSEELHQVAPQVGALDLFQSGLGRARPLLDEAADVQRERVVALLVVYHLGAEPAR